MCYGQLCAVIVSLWHINPIDTVILRYFHQLSFSVQHYFSWKSLFLQSSWTNVLEIVKLLEKRIFVNVHHLMIMTLYSVVIYHKSCKCWVIMQHYSLKLKIIDFNTAIIAIISKRLLQIVRMFVILHVGANWLMIYSHDYLLV